MARKSGSIEDKKAIHVSFSDKEYCEKMQKIIGKWDENGINRSQKVCDMVIAMNKFELSPAVNRVLKTYDWIENTISPYFEDKKDPNFSKVIDTIFNEILEINGAKLTDFLSNPNAYIIRNTDKVNDPVNVVTSSNHKVENTNSTNDVIITKEKVTENNTTNNAIINEDVPNATLNNEISVDTNILTKGNKDNKSDESIKSEEIPYNQDNRTFIKKEDVLNDTDEEPKEDNKENDTDDFKVSVENLDNILRTFN